MKYQFVIQFPENLNISYDDLIEIEEGLENNLSVGQIDGHDIGSGQMNIFILTDDPHSTFQEVKKLLKEENNVFSDAKIAYRDIESDTFVCLWPESLDKFEII